MIIIDMVTGEVEKSAEKQQLAGDASHWQETTPVVAPALSITATETVPAERPELMINDIESFVDSQD